MDKFEKLVITVTGIVIMLFIFSLVYAKTSRRADLPECIPYNKAYETPAVKKIDSNLYQVYAVAQMWQFQPAQIFL